MVVSAVLKPGGKPEAVIRCVAQKTAHKLARIFYRLWTTGVAYTDPGMDYYEQKYQECFLISIPNAAAWLRRVIIKAAQEELMQQKTDKPQLPELLEPLTPEQRDRAIAMLKSWRECDEAEAQEQQETLEYLVKALDEDRLSDRKLLDQTARSANSR